jgi:hypothetical protein
LIPLLVPPKNVVLVTGFCMAFFGLLFSGGLSPVTYEGMSKHCACLTSCSVACLNLSSTCCRHLRQQSFGALQRVSVTDSIFYRGANSFRVSLSPRTEWIYANKRSDQLSSRTEFICPLGSCAKRLECAGAVMLRMVLGCSPGLFGWSDYSMDSSRCYSRFGTLQAGQETVVEVNKARGCSEGFEHIQEHQNARCSVLHCLRSSILSLFVDYSAWCISARPCPD